jgi:hypothetical protein
MNLCVQGGENDHNPSIMNGVDDCKLRLGLGRRDTALPEM